MNAEDKYQERSDLHCRGVISLEYLGFFLFLDIRSIEQSLQKVGFKVKWQLYDEGTSKISTKHLLLIFNLQYSKC